MRPTRFADLEHLVELVPTEHEHLHRVERRHRRDALAAVDEGHLAEEYSGADAPDLVAVDSPRDRVAFDDHEELDARLAFACDLGAGVDTTGAGDA